MDKDGIHGPQQEKIECCMSNSSFFSLTQLLHPGEDIRLQSPVCCYLLPKLACLNDPVS